MILPIPATFIAHAADILGDTNRGLTGSQIAKECSAYAIDFNMDIPYPIPSSISQGSNKRAVLRDNLLVFSPEQQFKIIKELCELSMFSSNDDVKALKIKLVSRYGHLNQGIVTDQVNETLIEETKHWLEQYPDSLKLYNQALEKLNNNIHQRNLLDDLRLSLELLLKTILNNEKSLENQIPAIGSFISNKGGSKELSNMFMKLLDYYGKYHNSYVKHNDAVIDNEIEILFEMTSSFMKFLIRLNYN